MKTPEGTAPQFLSWYQIFSSYTQGTVFDNIITSPKFSVSGSGIEHVQLFEGETGDTSNPLDWTLSFLGPPSGGPRTYYLNGVTLNETTRFWPRIISDTNYTDGPSALLVVTGSGEELEFIDWYSTIQDVDAGTKIHLSAKLDPPSRTADYTWYWGESGDTSTPITDPGSLQIGFNNLIMTVPDESRSFWVHVAEGEKSIDSPTAYIEPLPIHAPTIIDEPDDSIVMDLNTSVGVKMIAHGGNLTYDWYQGERGDTSTPITANFPPISNGQEFNATVPITSDKPMVWARVSNDIGSIDTRTVHYSKATIEDLIITRYDRRYYLTAQANETNRIRPFVHGLNISTHYGEILRYSNDENEWESIYTGTRGTTFGYADYDHSFLTPIDQSILPDLPSGTYRIRFSIDGEHLETGDIELFNELIDGPTGVAPYANLLVYPGPETEGGLYTATISLAFPYLGQTIQVYSGLIGDKSAPVPTTSKFSFLGEDYDSNNGRDLRERIFDVSWQPNDADVYWMEVEKEEGGIVQILLKPADSTVLDEDILNGTKPLEITVPKGIDTIPLPRLPEIPDWTIGSAGNKGATLELPFGSENITRSDMALWPDSSASLGGINGIQIVVKIDDSAPPMLSKTPARLALDWDGRAIWTGKASGDINLTLVHTGPTPDNLIDSKTYSGVVDQGFIVSPDANYARVEWITDGPTQHFEAPIVRLPRELQSSLGIESFWEDNMLTTRLGSFLTVSNYPWLYQSEMAWWYVIPDDSGFFFYARTTGDDYSWNWANENTFPYIYSFTTNNWLYYLMHSHGWFYDFSSQAWEFVSFY